MPRIACQLSDVLLAARQALVDAGVFTDSQAFLAVDSDDIMSQVPASPICAVTFTAFDHRADTWHCEMDPTEESTMDGELVCSIWLRVQLDSRGIDTQLLTNPTLGASQLVRQVIATLNNQMLTDTDGNDLLWRTLFFLGIRNRGRWRPDRNWRRIDVRFNCSFSWDPTAPAPEVTSPILFSDNPDDEILYSDAGGVLIWE